MWNETVPLVGLVLVVALLAGCAAPGDVESTDMGSATIAPGNAAGLPLILEESEWQPDETTLRVVDDAGLDVEVQDHMIQGSGGALVTWVTIHVPNGTDAGTHRVVVAVDHEDDSFHAGFNVHAETPDPALVEGQTVLLSMTLRTQDGATAFSNDPDVIDAPIPLVPGADPPADDPEPFPFPLNPNPQLPPELLDAILASGVGHHVQAEAPDAYGAAQVERQEPRQESLPRIHTEQRAHELDRQTAIGQGLINETSEEGDPVEAGGDLPYVITQINDTMVTITLDVEQGGGYTLYPAWDEASEVVELTDAQAVFRTTPSTPEGASFTWRPEWPNATTVVSMDDDTIELRHSPAVGTTYTATTQQGGDVEATVQALGETEITITEANPHPLAGQTLLFELIIEGLQEPQGGQSGMGPAP